MYAKTAYHMHANKFGIIYMPKSNFVYQYHKFLFLFGVLFMCIFIRLGLHIHMTHGGIYSENVFPSLFMCI